MIKQAIASLEVFPMTMTQLEQTGLAQIMQSIRHKVDSPLQKRIRFIIKAWRKLLEPNSSTVVPLNLQPALKPSSSAAAKLSVTTPAAHETEQPSAPEPVAPKTHITSHPVTSQSSVALGQSVYPTPRRKLPQTPNGISPRPTNGRSSVTEAPKLAKVKSTAELIQAAGGCIDSFTKDKILTNQIVKESDELPRVVPQAAMRTARRPKNEQSTTRTPKAATTASSRGATQSLPAPPPPHISAAKSEMIAKFLEHTAEMTAEKEVSPQSLSRQQHQLQQQQLKHQPQPPPSDLAQDVLKSKHKHHHHHHNKEKKKHKRRHGEAMDESEAKKAATIPVTNRMDQWPELPPISEEALAQASSEDCYHSGETPSTKELCDMGNVEALVSGSWIEVSATRGDADSVQPMTALYSVDMGNDELMHILPWTNLAGYQQTFFPSSGCVEEDMDKLTDLPDPW